MPRMTAIVLAVMLLAALPAPPRRALGPALDATAAARFATLALDCVAREYPNKIAHVLTTDDDARPPRLLTPAFYGCYDWHSAVHGHWLLARLARTFPERAFRRARARGPGAEPHRRQRRGRGRLHPRQGPHDLRAALRPGLAPPARGRAAGVERRGRRAPGRPLSPPSRRRRRCGSSSGCPKLSRPIRVGEHDQTAFAFGLVLDWAAVSRPRRARATSSAAAPATSISATATARWATSRRGRTSSRPAWPRRTSCGGSCPRRASRPGSPPSCPRSRRDRGAGLARAGRRDRSQRPQARPSRRPEPQPRLDARRDRLRRSPPSDPRLPALRAVARAHREAGLASVTGAHYEGGHWLGTFAVYLDDAAAGYAAA